LCLDADFLFCGVVGQA
jgi:hypothetical protein